MGNVHQAQYDDFSIPPQHHHKFVAKRCTNRYSNLAIYYGRGDLMYHIYTYNSSSLDLKPRNTHESNYHGIRA
jgi:hypothetical protein